MQRLIASTGEQNLYSYLDIIYANERVSVFANLTSVLILGALYQGTVSPWVLWSWAAIWLLNSVVQLTARPVYRYASGYSLSRKLGVYLAIGAVNCVCAGGSSLLFAHSSLEHGFYIQALFISFYFTGVFTANAYIWPFYLASTATIVFPMISLGLLSDTRHGVATGAGLAVMWVLVSLYARRYARTFGESIRLQHEKGKLLEALLIEKQRVDRAHEAQLFFLSAISHDLKQPLYAMRLLADTARDEHADVPRITHAMDKTLDDLDEMFDSIIQIGEIEAEQIKVSPAPFLLAEVLKQIENRFALIAAERKLTLRVALPSRADAGPVIYTDRLLLERLLANLVANAIRYTEKGSIWIGWRPQRRCIEVRDSGIGIPAEKIASIFDAFTQIEPRRNAGGVGLGLAICQRLCQRLNIGIQVRSRQDSGSVFSLLFPEAALNRSCALGSVAPLETTPPAADKAGAHTA